MMYLSVAGPSQPTIVVEPTTVSEPTKSTTVTESTTIQSNAVEQASPVNNMLLLFISVHIRICLY